MTEIVEQLKNIADDLSDQRDVEKSLKARRKELMQEAHDGGMTFQAIGNALGVTKAYVHQQIGKRRKNTVDAVGIVDIEMNDDGSGTGTIQLKGTPE